MSVRRHTTYNIVGAAVPLALSLVTVPLYLKLIGAERYGVLSIAWLLLGYFGLFDLGLGRATSFRIAALRDAEPQTRADTFWAALAFNVAVGIVGGAILWIVASLFFAHGFKVDEALRPEILASVPLLAISVPVATLTGVLTGALQGRERFLETNIISMTSTILFQLIPLTLAATHSPNLVMLLCGALAAKVVALMLIAYRCHREITRGHLRRFNRSEASILMRYGGWVTLTSLFGPILTIVDRFAIGAVLGATAVAAYNVPFQLAKQIAIVPSALTNAMFPRLSAAPEHERRTSTRIATRSLSALISLPVLGGIFLMEPFLNMWVGPTLGDQAAPVGRILLIGFWANAFALPPYTQLQSSGRPDLVTKMLLLEIPPYLAALYFGMTHFGLEGAALALSARFILDYFMLTFAAGRDFSETPLLAANLVLLGLAALSATEWAPHQGIWWASAVLLSLITLLLGWRALPNTMKEGALRRLTHMRKGTA